MYMARQNHGTLHKILYDSGVLQLQDLGNKSLTSLETLRKFLGTSDTNSLLIQTSGVLIGTISSLQVTLELM